VRKITIHWGDTPISEEELAAKLAVPFWEPKTFDALSVDERRAYLNLRWWDAKVQRHLPSKAREFYRHLDETRSRSRFGDMAFTEQLESIADPLERLDAINDALVLLMAEMNEVSQLRREALLAAEMEGASTRELADVLHITLPRVRQLIIEARRKAGLPVDPQHGGRNHNGNDNQEQ
jgi:hypothetical protein